jgi:hypothetical protein
LDRAADSDNHVVQIDLFSHGDWDRIYIGTTTSDYNKITMNNVKSLVNNSETLRAIRIYACYTGDSQSGISGALANQLRVDVWAIRGPTIFSSRADRVTTRGNLPDTGPAYLIPDGGFWRKFPF